MTRPKSDVVGMDVTCMHHAIVTRPKSDTESLCAVQAEISGTAQPHRQVPARLQLQGRRQAALQAPPRDRLSGRKRYGRRRIACSVLAEASLRGRALCAVRM